MAMKFRHVMRLTLAALCVVAVAAVSPLATAGASPVAGGPAPITGEAIQYAESPAVRDLAPSAATSSPARRHVNPRVNPLAGRRNAAVRGNASPDLLIAAAAAGTTPAPNFTFEGVGNPFACGGCSPPDTTGDVGRNHYIQMVNATKVAIFDKTGAALAAPFDLGSLWPSGECASNTGDPIVVYDRQADRWLLSQFAFPTHLCFAISKTADPLGGYYLYTFNVGEFPDYFKVGVWDNSYSVSANEVSGYTAYSFDRKRMLQGKANPKFVKFTGETNLLLPADVDSPNPPRAQSPALFYTFKDGDFHGGADRLELFALRADFATPANSTFDLAATIPVAPFTYTVCGFFNFDCVFQRDTAQRVDAVSEWPMQRLVYRRNGNREVLLGNFTVGGGTGQAGAAIRWFELRNTKGAGWTLFQEGTQDTGDGNDRFMGSIAMDRRGNIALGYSVSSSTLYPSIRYAIRTPADPLGTLRTEVTLQAGGGSQTASNRWGDYSSMTVDPADDCTFWYTNEYYPVTSATNWATRIGNFREPGCV